GRWRGLARIGLVLRPSEPLRIQRLRQRHRVQHHGELSAVADLEIEFGVAVDAFGLAVVAEAVGAEIGRIDVVAETLVDAARTDVCAPLIETATAKTREDFR